MLGAISIPTRNHPSPHRRNDILPPSPILVTGGGLVSEYHSDFSSELPPTGALASAFALQFEQATRGPHGLPRRHDGARRQTAPSTTAQIDGTKLLSRIRRRGIP